MPLLPNAYLPCPIRVNTAALPYPTSAMMDASVLSSSSSEGGVLGLSAVEMYRLIEDADDCGDNDGDRVGVLVRGDCSGD